MTSIKNESPHFFLLVFIQDVVNKQDYYPLQKMVDDVPSIDKKGHKKEKKHKRESKVEMPSLATTVNTQTSPDFTPEELLTELGFDLSRTAPTATSIIAVDEKKRSKCLSLSSMQPG